MRKYISALIVIATLIVTGCGSENTEQQSNTIDTSTLEISVGETIESTVSFSEEVSIDIPATEHTITVYNDEVDFEYDSENPDDAYIFVNGIAIHCNFEQLKAICTVNGSDSCASTITFVSTDRTYSRESIISDIVTEFPLAEMISYTQEY